MCRWLALCNFSLAFSVLHFLFFSLSVCVCRKANGLWRAPNDGRIMNWMNKEESDNDKQTKTRATIHKIWVRLFETTQRKQ